MAVRMRLILSFCLWRCFPFDAAIRGRGGGGKDAAAVHWLTSYRDAITAADQQNKMLLIYFCDRCANSPCERFKKETLDDSQVRGKLRDYVCLRLPVDAKITVQGKPVVLLEHEAFHEMLGRPGVAIVDYRGDAKPRGSVVSEFPITESLWYTPEQMAVILTLPPGTLTQRTLIYAVRVHPDHPASTDGEPNPMLLEEAQSHSQYQADIRVQGHHFWGSRFARILSRLPGVAARAKFAPRVGAARTWSRRRSSASAVGGSPPAIGARSAHAAVSSATT